MAIARGVSLGPYEILNRIGEGGMGEVWRARDRRIGRDVAVKVLPESFTRGDERILRFEQEARAAGALNHPGLVTIFDVGTTDGSPYIVMEYLEGENLREVLGDSVPIALPLRKVIDYAMQVASALAVAHEKGIIHRDLKPENIFVTADKRTKILDFGLAKLAAESTDLEGRHRTAKHLTSAGVAVGTPGYMSPEQVRAQPLDARTDIFSLGSVIYEMASGRPAFECFSAIETMHAVLNVEPPSLATFIPNIPPALDAIVRHCMEKNPRDRFQSTRDLAFQLQMLLPEVENRTTDIRRLTLPQPPAARRLPVRAAIAGTAVVLALAAGGWALFRAGAGASPGTARTFKQLTFADGLETFPTLAPDGKSVAYVSSQSGNRDIYVQRVDGRTAINITSDSPDADAEPAFSPDGSFIAFRSEREGGGIFVMGVTGENVRRLTDFGHNPSWSPDGKRIVISTAGTELRPHVHSKNGDLWIVDTRTGARRLLLQHKTPAQLPGLMGSDAVQPSWSPHGNRIAFWGVSSQFAQRDIWTIEPDAPQPEQTIVRATSDPALHWNPVWSPDGRYLYYGSNRDGTLNLWRVAIDEESGKVTGTPEPLSLPAPISGNFGFSQQGELAYTTVTRLYRLLGLPFDAASGVTGEPITFFGGTQEILSFELSPDRQTIAFTTGGAQEDLFVANVDGTRLRQLTNDAARDRTATWSSDGNTLFFSSNRDGGYHLWSIRADGSNLTRATDNGDLKRVGASNVYSPNASPDGQSLVGEAENGALLVHLDRPVTRRLEVIGKGINAPKWSPDGKLLVGSTDADAAGRRGIGIYSFGTRRIEQVLPQGLSPQWLPGGRQVAFFADRRVGVLDLESRRETMHSVLPLEGVRLDDTVVKPRLSRDGRMLYVRQTLEQSDIWMVRFEKE